MQESTILLANGESLLTEIELTDRFLRAVEQALEHVRQPRWLGQQSPLALPYMLGAHLRDAGRVDLPEVRGAILAGLIRSGSQSLTQEQQRLLDQAYFSRNGALKSYGVAQVLGVSESTYFRQRSNALHRLAEELHRLLQPAVRREHPIAAIVRGRDAIAANCLRTLNRVQSVAVTGPGGIGKTSFGAFVSHLWLRAFDGKRHGAVFWYTLRAGLNDSLSCFVFALGDFLREQGVVTLWRQIVADRGVLRPDYILGVIRHDLHELTRSGKLSLFCIDEADMLQGDRDDHKALLAVFEEMKGVVPLMLLGQRLVVEPHQHIALNGLSVADVSQWLHEHHFDASDQQLGQLMQVTAGNPAMISLVVALRSLNEPLDALLGRMVQSASISLLMDRVWMRLTESERHVLIQLSAYRSPVPQDVIRHSSQNDTWTRLVAHGLIQLDELGAATLPSYVRDRAVMRLPDDAVRASHIAAGDVRSMLGQFTDAAYHYIRAGEPELAIKQWWVHRFAEKERGQAQIAHGLFSMIAEDQLRLRGAGMALSLVLAFVSEIVGNSVAMDAALSDAQSWSRAPWAQIAQARLKAIAKERQGAIDQAERQYLQGIQSAMESVPMQLIQLHLGLGQLYADRLSDPAQAAEEALKASVWSERFLGIVAEQGGSFDTARDHYSHALAASERLTRDQRSVRARVLVDFGILDWKQGRSESAINHLLEAEEIFRHQGDVVRLGWIQINLSAAYIVARKYDQALLIAREGLAAAESMRNDMLIAGLASNASEACLGLGDNDGAENYAVRCLQLEESAHRVNALTVLAHVYRAKGQISVAESTFRSAIQTAQDQQDPAAEAPAWRGLAEMLLAEGVRDRAQEALARAKVLFEQLDLKHEVEVLQQLAREAASETETDT